MYGARLFTKRTTLFTKLFTCLYNQNFGFLSLHTVTKLLISLEILVSITSLSFIALHFLVSEIANVLSKVAYCCFTRITLFTKLFTCWYHQRYCFLSLHQVLLPVRVTVVHSYVSVCVCLSVCVSVCYHGHTSEGISRLYSMYNTVIGFSRF